MSAQSTVSTVRARLDRLAVPARELSTTDPLMCEIMIANTLANLAIAEAILESNKLVTQHPYPAVPKTPYSPFGNSGNFAQRQEAERQQEMLSVGRGILNVLEDILTAIKNFVKAYKR